MSKAFQLTIPKPCHENWDKMTQAEKGKFCSSCQKQVIDFTSMNDRELAAFFKKPSTGSVCGRFNNDQLNKELEIPRKRIPWLKYFFTIALPAMLTSSKATAQGEVKKIIKKEITVTKRPAQVWGNVLPRTKCFKQEIVAPIHIPPIPIQGDVQIVQENDSINRKEELIGSSTTEVQIDKTRLTPMNIINEISLTGTVGMVAIEKRPAIVKKDSLNFIQRIYKEISFKNFKFYPNPAASNSNITIQWKKPEAGDFEIQLMNQQGQVINTKTEVFLEKINSIQFDIPFISSGNYFLVMINRKSGNRITEKIIIQ
jgi:hypothetical protein